MEHQIKSWNEFFRLEQNKPYFNKLNHFLDEEYKAHICYPSRELLLNAFHLTQLKDVKVVIIGQDPYHEPNQAMGLAFSVPNGIEVPPSLLNIYKEIEKEYDVRLNKENGDLTNYAQQGVLFLNSILSVRAHQPLSHNILEYKTLLQNVLTCLNSQDQPIVFMLWGSSARKLKNALTNPKHLVLESVHPSPLSANRGGWFGNNHFKMANKFLSDNKVSPIDWINK